MTTKTFEVGQSVRVKDGIKDVDFGTDIGGWQGRVKEMFDGNKLVAVLWDSVTLRNTSSEYITKCEQDGMGWEEYRLGIEDIEPATARDSQEDVDEAIDELSSAHAYDHLDGPDGELIRKVFAVYEGEIEDEDDELYAWDEYLTKHLNLPFAAEVSEIQERGPFQAGDKVKVVKLYDTDERYGIIVKLGPNSKGTHFPLCDLEVVDSKSPQHLIVLAYATWFANK